MVEGAWKDVWELKRVSRATSFAMNTQKLPLGPMDDPKVHTKWWVEQKAKVQQKRKSNLQKEAARTGSPQKPHHGM